MVDSNDATTSTPVPAEHSRPVSPLNEHEDELPNYSARDPHNIPLETRGRHHDLSAHRNITLFSCRSLKDAVKLAVVSAILYIIVEGAGWGLVTQLEAKPKVGSHGGMANYSDTYSAPYYKSEWETNEQW